MGMREKGTYQAAVNSEIAEPQDKRVYEIVIALIEIREAIENRLGVLATGQLVTATEVIDAIQENTAVQQQILDRQADAETAFRDLAENLGTLMHDVETVRATMKLHGGLMESIGQIQTEHADALAKLAEGIKAGQVETRAFLPDAG